MKRLGFALYPLVAAAALAAAVPSQAASYGVFDTLASWEAAVSAPTLVQPFQGYDYVRVSAVPEPASAALGLSGLGLLALRLRRRR